MLKRLHWLPVEQRITFKVATLTYKVLHNKDSPSYRLDFVTSYRPSRSLRSCSQCLLTIPNIKSAAARRSFSYAAPSVWNSLPLHIRTSSSLTSFRSLLKTFLFPPWTIILLVVLWIFDPARLRHFLVRPQLLYGGIGSWVRAGGQRHHIGGDTDLNYIVLYCIDNDRLKLYPGLNLL